MGMNGNMELLQTKNGPLFYTPISQWCDLTNPKECSDRVTLILSFWADRVCHRFVESGQIWSGIMKGIATRQMSHQKGAVLARERHLGVGVSTGNPYRWTLLENSASICRRHREQRRCLF
jgi:hypothetical protein